MVGSVRRVGRQIHEEIAFRLVCLVDELQRRVKVHVGAISLGLYLFAIVEEDRIPIREGVRAACEMLGIEALEIGNEGKVVVGVVAQKASNVLAAFRKTEQGRDAEIIGEVTDEFTSVVMETSVGGKRIIPSPVGDPIPRIC